MTMGDFLLNISSDPVQKDKTKVLKKKGSTKRKVSDESEENQETTRSVKKLRKANTSSDPGNTIKLEAHKSNQGGPISSLFGRNPVIPTIDETEVNPIEEEIFSSDLFKEAKDIHPYMVQNLEQNFGITKLTTVQRLSFPDLLSGRDALIRSQTGSGKTLAYAIPIIQNLQKIRPKISRADGIRALVILPTRELALQTYECFVKLTKSFQWIVAGILAGGEKRKSEKARLRKGLNILVVTSGRLLDHALHTTTLDLHRVNTLVLDEADKLLEMGYEKDISKILKVMEEHREQNSRLLNLPRRQTILLSATLTPEVERLAGLTLEEPSRVDASQDDTLSDAFTIPQSLEQKYIIVPPKLRLVTLASFIIRKSEVENESKMLVFMATQDMVDFHTELLATVLPKTAEFLKLHGSMTQPERTEVFKTFRAANAGVLLCTDVAARGLDLPKVDWIVQYTAPATPADYVHRVGRTARIGTQGSALLFLAPAEMPFYELLASKRIKLKEETVDYCLDSLLLVKFDNLDKRGRRWCRESAATELQLNFEQAVLDQKKLHDGASAAFKSWARFYASYPKEARPIFSFKNLHLGHYAKSMALRDAPSSITGIGKPPGKRPKLQKKKTKEEMGGRSRTQNLILSEFDSGLKGSQR